MGCLRLSHWFSPLPLHAAAGIWDDPWIRHAGSFPDKSSDPVPAVASTLIGLDKRHRKRPPIGSTRVTTIKPNPVTRRIKEFPLRLRFGWTLCDLCATAQRPVETAKWRALVLKPVAHPIPQASSLLLAHLMPQCTEAFFYGHGPGRQQRQAAPQAASALR